MNVYEQMRNDPQVINVYKEISLQKNYWHSKHGLEHINKVINTIENFLRKLKIDEQTIELAQIAGLLHDIGCKYGKDEHTKNSVIFVKEYLKNFDLNEEQQTIIVDAIAKHSSGEGLNNIVDYVLYFADKLDYDKNRITKDGLKVAGINQIANIEEIKIDINNNLLEVNFITNEKFNKNLLEEYYFTPKIFGAVEKMGNFLKIPYKTNLNGLKW